MSSQCRHAKSHTFAVRPTVLKQNSRSHALFQKSHDKFKNGKKKKIIFHIFIWYFVEKGSNFYLFSACRIVIFSTLFRTEYSSIITKICSSSVFFISIISVLEK